MTVLSAVAGKHERAGLFCHATLPVELFMATF